MENNDVSDDNISLVCASCHQVLSVQQLHRICTLYCDENYNTPSVSPDVNQYSYFLCFLFLSIFDSQFSQGEIYCYYHINLSLYLCCGQVISSMKLLMTDDPDDDSNSFLLHDDSR